MKQKQEYTTVDMSVRISALSDIVFKYILGSEGSTELLKSFINAVQKDSGFPEITAVDIKNPFNEKTFQDAKLSVIDIRARDNAGDWYNMEVQIKPVPSFQERSLYYWAKTYADQLKEGGEYSRLDKVIGINVLDYILLPDFIPYHSCFLLREKDRSEYVLTLDFILHYLEIPKMAEYTENDLTRWLYYLGHAGEEDETMEVLLKSNTCLLKADERYKSFTANEQARLAYQARSMFLHDRATELAVALDEKARETAKKLKGMGLSIGQIAEATGLLETEVEGL